MNIKKILKMFFIDYFLYWMGSFIVTLALIFLFMALEPIIAAIITFLYYPVMMLTVGAKYHDRLDTISEYEQNNHSKYTMYLYYGITAAYIILFVFFLAVCDGNVTDKRMLFSLFPAFPFSPLILLCHIFSTGIFDITDYYPYIYLLFFGTFLVIFTADIVYAKHFKNKKIGYIILLFILSIPICLLLNTKPLSDEQKYGGHGFDYMNGFSSTDFTGYHVYDGEKLATLDHESSLIIENEEDMPVLDGAEACYPLYSAVARTIYKDIDNIESNHSDHDYYNGKIVTFTNTVYGYQRLTDKEVDLIFAARPSSDQKEYAKEKGEEIISTPIGKEAFVFFVEKDNPVNDLSWKDIRSIYHGDITNWEELGGNDEEILAFQRPENSGSQATMEYFMGDVSLKDPLTYETVADMGGVVDRVAQYNNESGALGYSFRYFVEELHQENDVKILSVDGVYPSIETIENGTYPLTVDLVCSKLASNDSPNVDKVISFMLSPDGKELIRKTGYAANKK